MIRGEREGGGGRWRYPLFGLEESLREQVLIELILIHYIRRNQYITRRKKCRGRFETDNVQVIVVVEEKQEKVVEVMERRSLRRQS